MGPAGSFWRLRAESWPLPAPAGAGGPRPPLACSPIPAVSASMVTRLSSLCMSVFKCLSSHEDTGPRGRARPKSTTASSPSLADHVRKDPVSRERPALRPRVDMGPGDAVSPVCMGQGVVTDILPCLAARRGACWDRPFGSALCLPGKVGIQTRRQWPLLRQGADGGAEGPVSVGMSRRTFVLGTEAGVEGRKWGRGRRKSFLRQCLVI